MKKDFFQALNDKITKNKVEDMLSQINQGKANELIDNITPKDVEKMKKISHDFEDDKISELGIDIDSMLKNVSQSDLDKIKNKLSGINPELAQKFNNLLTKKKS